MSGTTNQGIDYLISQDPTAYWDGQGVVSPNDPSPRLVTLLAFDPIYSPGAGKVYVVVAKFLKVFIESRGSGGQINVRVVDTAIDIVPINPTTWGGLKRKY